jgi:apolipoprotein D and lipocalin family protein
VTDGKLGIALVALGLAACSTQPDYRAAESPPDTESQVDLERYAGLWYEIARYPNGFEDKDAYTCVGVTAEYALRTDGRIDVTNTCRKDTLDGPVEVANGVARTTTPSNARLKVKFAPQWVPFAEGDYWILATDYRTALVADPEGKYLWILAREPEIDEATRSRLVGLAQDRGYATEPLFWVPQPPA